MPPISRRNLPLRKRRILFAAVAALGFFAVVLVEIRGLFNLHYGNTTLGPGSFFLETEERKKKSNFHPKKFHLPNTIVKQKHRPVITSADFQGLQLLLSEEDPIYKWGSWDEAPIVIESHKLLFFTIPKCGCTVWKQLFRRIYGFQNWNVHDDYLPHHPMSNGLNYLYHYEPEEAERMLTDPSWTRAIFFRDPKERLLSAYLDKVMHDHGKYVRVHCCNGNMSLNLLLQCQVPEKKLPDPLLSFPDFLENVVPRCKDPHWRAQAHRLPDNYWPYVNFVGHMDHIEQDARDLLQKIGAWEDYGASGWKSGAIFAGTASVAHATNARRKENTHYTPTAKTMAERLHKIDYEHPVVSMTKEWRRST